MSNLYNKIANGTTTEADAKEYLDQKTSLSLYSLVLRKAWFVLPALVIAGFILGSWLF